MTTMTPEQKLKHMILNLLADWETQPRPAVTAENVDELYGALEETPYDARNEIRSSGVETGLKCDWSRHYESKAVAAQAPDGTWVGWTYWYGGGKHGEPEGIDWMDKAYDLTVTEEPKTIIHRTFVKVEATD